MSFLTITTEQRQALEDSGGMPVYAIDRVMMQKYVIMDAELYATAVEALREHDPYKAEIFDQSDV